jgi:hypothetical protein
VLYVFEGLEELPVQGLQPALDEHLHLSTQELSAQLLDILGRDRPQAWPRAGGDGV